MIRRFIIVVVASAFMTACGACGAHRGEEVRKGTLIERVGQRTGIKDVVVDFFRRLPDNEDLQGKFAGVDMAAFQANFAAELCVQVGGDCSLDTSMLAARGLDQDQYDAFVELFVVSMNKVKLPTKEQNDLIDALYAMRKKHEAATKNKTASAKDPS